jgi:hypothetical protein
MYDPRNFATRVAGRQLKIKGRGRRQKRGEMNKAEAAFELYLESLRRSGEIAEYGFEQIKFNLGPGAWFTPDFWSMANDGLISFYEVKGFMREAANVRLKTVADKYPFRFVLVTSNAGVWKQTEI